MNILNFSNIFYINLYIEHNMFDIINYYYDLYINYYWIFRILKNFFVILYFNILKLYIIFINDSIFSNFSNFLLINSFRLRKFIYSNLDYLNYRILKLNMKYKNYYKFNDIDYLKFFFFLILIYFLILMLRNKTTYYKTYFIWYPLLFYIIILFLCDILVPLFFYDFIIISFIFIFMLIISYIIILN